MTCSTSWPPRCGARWCSLLVAASDRLILCQEKKLQLLDFDGRLAREWVFDATVRYIKVTGGPAGGEGALIGLKDGTIVKIFVDQPFPVTVVKHARGGAGISSRDRRGTPRWTTTSVVVVYELEHRRGVRGREAELRLAGVEHGV